MVRVADGRGVGVHVTAGIDGGRTVVFCHGAPGSGAFDPDPEATTARGVTLIGIDRPGYGMSDPIALERWATVANAADDVVTVLESMGTGPVGIAGWSAGGRVALAVAARRPDLVDRVAVIATPAPHEAVPWMPTDQLEALDAMRGLSALEAREALEELRTPFVMPPDGVDMLDGLCFIGASAADANALAMPGARERLTAMMISARSGHLPLTALAVDIIGYCLRPWGFERSQIRAKVLLINGAKDPIAGPRHGKWWQRSLPFARYEQVPDAGHLVVVPSWQRVLSHLAPRGS